MCAFVAVVVAVVVATAVDAVRLVTVTFPNNLKILFALAFICQSQSQFLDTKERPAGQRGGYWPFAGEGVMESQVLFQ